VTGFSVLRVQQPDDRVVVDLNRPQARNAINAAMVAELHEVCAGLERTPKILILAGTGTDFAAGADIAELRQRGRDEALAGINRAVFDRIAGLPMPTIAAGASYRLAELIGKSVAKQVILGGRILDADAALQHGLVAEVVESGTALSVACALADRIGRSSALALRLSMAVLDAASPHPLLDDLAQAVLFESADKKDRMTRFLETRSS
jgi:enoyl-CoA hydratase/carnithine racemase